MRGSLFIILGFILLLAGCNHQTPTGRGQTLLFSNAEMQQMGKQSFTQIKAQTPINRDPKLNRYVNCVASRVLSVLPQSDQHWEVVLFDSPQVNAFALPGGYIGVYTGLLKVANTPDQLATVIGHEIAHVLANHGNEQVSRAKMKHIGLNVVNTALNLGNVEHKDLYMAALGLGAEVGITLPFGRKQETEADVLGLEYMSKAGFNPAASIHLWRNMNKAASNTPLEILSTHPSHGSRISELQQLQAKVRPLYRKSQQRHWPQCKLT